MVLRFFMLAAAFLFSCTSVGERDNCRDSGGINYNGCAGGVSPSSSSAELPLSSSGSIVYGYIVYQGETFHTVEIGAQVWLAKNLNYNDERGKCNSCSFLGRLYDWATAMELPPSCNTSSCASLILPNHRGICPAGFHIPSNDEWRVLINFVGSSPAIKLRANSSFWSINTGTDIYGFSALPGGYGDSYNFYEVGTDGYWWSSSEDSIIHITYMFDGVSVMNGSKSIFRSVRCVKDD